MTSARAGASKFQCDLTEPFVDLSIGWDAVVWREMIDGAETPVRMRIVSRKDVGSDMAFTVSVPSGMSVPPEARTIVLRNRPGGDGMSDREYARSVEIGSPPINSGGCTPLQGHHTLHRVVGVAAGDELNVRRSASASAAVLATVPPGGRVWVSGIRRPVGSWTPVSVVTFPGREKGRARIVEGWANRRFLESIRV